MRIHVGLRKLRSNEAIRCLVHGCKFRELRSNEEIRFYFITPNPN